MWFNSSVTVDGVEYEYEAKVYDNPSMFGIENGRVSKLYIPKLGFEYDRGGEEDFSHPAVRKILDLYSVKAII